MVPQASADSRLVDRSPERAAILTVAFKPADPFDLDARMFATAAFSDVFARPNKELLVALSEQLCADCEACWGKAWCMDGQYTPAQLQNEARARLVPFTSQELRKALLEYDKAEDKNRNMLHCTFDIAAGTELQSRLGATMREAYDKLGRFRIANVLAAHAIDELYGLRRFVGAESPKMLSKAWWADKALCALVYLGSYKAICFSGREAAAAFFEKAADQSPNGLSDVHAALLDALARDDATRQAD